MNGHPMSIFDRRRYPVYVRAAGRHACRARDLAAAGDYTAAAEVLLNVDAIAEELGEPAVDDGRAPD